MLQGGEKIGVALSGGADSMAMMAALVEIASSMQLSIHVLHMNHGLRGEESDSEELFARDTAAKSGLAFEAKRVSIPALRKRRKGSIEAVSREVRYNFFTDAAQRHGLDRIALGHTMCDQAETVMMRIIRGTGSSGLRGILPVREDLFIRPLINVTRTEVENFLKVRGIHYVNDSSNKDERYMRNRVRKRLMPLLREEFSRLIDKRLADMAAIANTDDECLETIVEETLQNWGFADNSERTVIHREQFLKLHRAIRWRIVRRLLRIPAQQNYETGYIHLRAVVNLAEGSTSHGIVDLPGGMEARREYEKIFIRRKSINEPRKERWRSSGYCHAVEIPGIVAVPEAGISLDFKRIPRDALPFGQNDRAFIPWEDLQPPIVVRTARPGDRIRFAGFDGSKKINEVFIDEKVPRSMRSKIPLVADEKGILWIVGIKIGTRTRLKDGKHDVLGIQII